MSNIMFIVLSVIFVVLVFSTGVIVGQWANLPTSEWDKLDKMPIGKGLWKLTKWTYWSIRRFFRKMNRAYPFND